jgi:hypothetical protein
MFKIKKIEKKAWLDINNKGKKAIKTTLEWY